MKEKIPALADYGIYLIFTILAFLLPVFFLPITTEYFEFNKMYLALGASVIVAILWIAKVLAEKRLDLPKSPLNLPILALTLVYAASTYFSISRYTSVFGSYGRWGNSMMVMAISAFLYFAAASNIKGKQKINYMLLALLGGGTFSSLVAVFSYLGISLINQPYAQIKNFTLTGSTTTSAVIGVICLIIALGNIVKSQNTVIKSMLLALALINTTCALMLSNYSVLLFLVVALLSFLVFTSAELITESKVYLSSILVLTLILGIIMYVPAFKNAFKLGKDYPAEIKLDFNSSRIVTTYTLGDFPLLGSGPSTFYLNFKHYKPLYLNATDVWAVNFDKANNEFLEIAATLGLLGLLVYAWVAYRAVKLARLADKTPLNATLSAITLGFFAFFLMNFSTPMLSIILFVCLGALSSYVYGSLSGKTVIHAELTSVVLEQAEAIVNTKTISMVFSGTLLLLTVAVSYFGSRAYAGDYFFKKALTSAAQNKTADTYKYETLAIQKNPFLDVYRAPYIDLNFSIANALVGSKKAEDLSDDEKSQITSLLTTAIDQTVVNTEILNPTSPDNWAQRARLNELLAPIKKDSLQAALDSYTRAIQFDPTNPQLRLALGNMFFTNKDFASAQRYYQAAISLKRDYANAHYNNAQALLQLKDYKNASLELQVVLRLLPNNSADKKKVEEELAQLNKSPEVAGTATTAPAIDLESQKKATQNQEPLKKPTAPETPKAQ